jgi:hypothetical protein
MEDVECPNCGRDLGPLDWRGGETAVCACGAVVGLEFGDYTSHDSFYLVPVVQYLL